MTAHRILLGQLISNGDCLYTTAVAAQIKRDFPGCHLTWAVSAKCRTMIEHNPLVDAIWEIPLPSWQDAELRAAWTAFERDALRKYDAGEFDFAFFTQIYPGNPHHADGTVRPGIFRGYPGRMTVDIRPCLVLTPAEVQEVFDFAVRHRLGAYERVILFECASKSGQSPLTPENAYTLARGIVSSRLERVAVILCSHFEAPGDMPGIIDGSKLTLRQMAELTRYAHLLIGGSSGISCISTSTWSKRLPMIQVLSPGPAMFASLAHDYDYFGLPGGHVIEMFGLNLESVWGCYRTIFAEGWDQARAAFHQLPEIRFDYYLDFLRQYVARPGDGCGVAVSLEATLKRYGEQPELLAFLKEFAAPHLDRAGRAAPPEEQLLALKRHFRQQAGLTGDDDSLTPEAYLQKPLPALRPITCEPILRRSEADYLALLKAQCPEADSDPNLLPGLARALANGGANDALQALRATSPGRPVTEVFAVLAPLANASFTEAWAAFAALKRKLGGEFTVALDEVLCDLAWMRGHHDEALESCRRCLQANPGSRRLQRIAERLDRARSPLPS